MHLCVRRALQKTVGGHLANVKHPSLGSGPLHAEAGERGPPDFARFTCCCLFLLLLCYCYCCEVVLYCYYAIVMAIQC